MNRIKYIEKVTFYCRPQDDKGIYHTFPVNSESKHDTAKSWASSNGRYNSPMVEPVVFEYDNAFDNVTIVDLYYRGNGGRAYQVVIEHDGKKFKVDLREDTVMDVIENTGIQAGGRLNGSFCFVSKQAQTNLIRIDSNDYELAKAKLKKLKENTNTIKKSELKVGHLYESLNGSKSIFLGHVYTRTVVYEHEGKILEPTPTKKMLFYEFNEKYNKIEEVEKILNGELEHDYYWRVHLKTSHTFKIDSGKVLDITVEDAIKGVHRIGKKHFDKHASAEIANSWNWTFMQTGYELTHIGTDKNIPKDEEMILQIDNSKRKGNELLHRRW